MASLFTGFQPWRNQSFGTDAAVLRPELVTLPEALRALGYETTGFFSNVWLRDTYGYQQGFGTFRYFREGHRVEARAAPPRARAPSSCGRTSCRRTRPTCGATRCATGCPTCRRACRSRVPILDLEPYIDPAVPLPPQQARVFRAMYQMNVAWADAVLGRMLAALRKSGQWDRTLLVVTSDHGEEFKECGHDRARRRPLPVAARGAAADQAAEGVDRPAPGDRARRAPGDGARVRDHGGGGRR